MKKTIGIIVLVILAAVVYIIGNSGLFDVPNIESEDQQEQVEPQEEIEPDQPDVSVDIGQGSIDIRYPGGGVDIKRRFR